jgi:hypothetical protein
MLPARPALLVDPAKTHLEPLGQLSGRENIVRFQLRIVHVPCNDLATPSLIASFCIPYK